MHPVIQVMLASSGQRWREVVIGLICGVWLAEAVIALYWATAWVAWCQQLQAKGLVRSSAAWPDYLHTARLQRSLAAKSCPRL